MNEKGVKADVFESVHYKTLLSCILYSLLSQPERK